MVSRRAAGINADALREPRLRYLCAEDDFRCGGAANVAEADKEDFFVTGAKGATKGLIDTFHVRM